MATIIRDENILGHPYVSEYGTEAEQFDLQEAWNADNYKQRRHYTEKGSIGNFNTESVDPDTGLERPIVYIQDYLGKFTAFRVYDADRFIKRFPPGEQPTLLEDGVQTNTQSLQLSSEEALKVANDACAAMSTVGGLSPDISALASDTEKQAGEMLTATTTAAGTVGEVVSTVTTSIEDLTALISKAAGLVGDLTNAGFTDLATALSEAIDEATQLIEASVNGLNAAVGDDAVQEDPETGELKPIGEVITEAITTVATAVAAASAMTTNLVAAVSTGGCKTVTAALQAVPFTPSGEAGAIQTKLKQAQPVQSRMLKAPNSLNPKGQVVNFNIDKKLPYADIQYKGKLTRMYYEDASTMQERFGTLGQGNLLAGEPDVPFGGVGGFGAGIA